MRTNITNYCSMYARARCELVQARRLRGWQGWLVWEVWEVEGLGVEGLGGWQRQAVGGVRGEGGLRGNSPAQYRYP